MSWVDATENGVWQAASYFIGTQGLSIQNEWVPADKAGVFYDVECLVLVCGFQGFQLSVPPLVGGFVDRG
jgi:hypothetical protein